MISGASRACVEASLFCLMPTRAYQCLLTSAIGSKNGKHMKTLFMVGIQGFINRALAE